MSFVQEIIKFNFEVMLKAMNPAKNISTILIYTFNRNYYPLLGYFAFITKQFRVRFNKSLT